VDNGALAFERGDNLTFAGTISGTGTVTENGAGILTLTGANMFSGGVTIAAGEISIGQIDALGTGALTFSGNDTALEAQGDGVFDDALSVAAGVSATLGAVAGETLDLSCAGGFTENGGPGAALHFGSSVDTGTVELAMSGTISALANSGVSVDGGELLVGNSAAARYLQQLFALTVGSGAAAAKLDLNGLAVRAQNLRGRDRGRKRSDIRRGAGVRRRVVGIDRRQQLFRRNDDQLRRDHAG
jgi:fibronectin-binding autotransporter adhesin